ncbi:hypothetical protein HDU84_009305 [Entophlyctis sp. JEL0112]|nr:hypothetical protein HDU84_009305 [Entophlyctis sp. JEL0112]
MGASVLEKMEKYQKGDIEENTGVGVYARVTGLMIENSDLSGSAAKKMGRNEVAQTPIYTFSEENDEESDGESSSSGSSDDDDIDEDEGGEQKKSRLKRDEEKESKKIRKQAAKEEKREKRKTTNTKGCKEEEAKIVSRKENQKL